MIIFPRDSKLTDDMRVALDTFASSEMLRHVADNSKDVAARDTARGRLVARAKYEDAVKKHK